MHERENIKNGFSVRFSASLEGIDSVCDETKQFLHQNGLHSCCFDVILGMREVLTNAVRHGSVQDQAQKVFCSVTYDNNRIVVRVADQGPGFDWRQAEKKCSNEANTCGRGICILGIYFDSYFYNDKGNEVELVKKVTNPTT